MTMNYIPGYGESMFKRIQARKQEWNSNYEPLIDGTLGPGGPFDQASDTVASAAQSSEGWKELQFVHACVLAKAPLRVIELGTNVGVSSAYIGTALRACGRDSTLLTIDASPYRLRLARSLHQELGLDCIHYRCGLFYDLLQSVLKEQGPIDCAYIDGQHEYQATMDFFDMIRCHSNPAAMLLFDDVGGGYSDGMNRAWEEIARHSGVSIAGQVGNIGIVKLV